jgi:signal peptidase II
MREKMNVKRLAPLWLTAAVIALDQITKALIIKRFPEPGMDKIDIFNNSLLWIVHVRNKVIAFSLGESLPENLRPFLFVAVPILVLVFLLVYFIKSNDFTTVQRYAIAGIIGGGAGNIIDRIARPDGVVDFISVKFFGIFGFERWPTFNAADSSVVVCVFIWLISLIISTLNESKENKGGKTV